MRFEWDEAKRTRNRVRHKVDLADAVALFDGRAVVTVASPRGDELRYASTGCIGEKHWTVIWTERGDAVRLISLRRARDGERRQHQERYA